MNKAEALPLHSLQELSGAPGELDISVGMLWSRATATPSHGNLFTWQLWNISHVL